MKMYLISDNDDTLTGMRLAGINGVTVHDKYAFKKEFTKAISNKDIAIVVITEKLSSEYKELINETKLSKNLPLIVEVPDRHGTTRPDDFITQYVREAIGIKI